MNKIEKQKIQGIGLTITLRDVCHLFTIGRDGIAYEKFINFDATCPLLEVYKVY